MLIILTFQSFLLLNLLLLSPQSSKSLTETITSSGHSISYPPFEYLNIKQAIANTKLHPAKSSSLNQNPDHKSTQKSTNHNITSLKLNLVHRDNLSFSWKNNHEQRFMARIKRDVKRVARLTRSAVNEVSGFGSEVVSGMDQGSGEYFVRIGVGSPAKSQYMVIDSGSDVVWVQCQPCSQCYHQSDPVFDPADSASFAGVSCGSVVCERVENSGCHAGRCKYEVSYGDGSYTKGTLATETITIGHTMVQNLAIGCGHMNQGMFIGAAGLLGIGGGSMSIVGQLGGQTGGAFSYCLVSRGSGSYGHLEFGQSAFPEAAMWVPLLRNPRAPTFYYVGLSRLGIGGVRIPIAEDTFRLSESGDGGVVIDTGTAVTRLPIAAYVALRDTFMAETANLPRAPGMSIFDTCYDLSEFVSVRVPTVSFFFSGGPILTVPAGNFLIPVDNRGTFCFAFAPSPTGLSIIGNIQQEGIQLSFDTQNGYVGFGPNIC